MNAANSAGELERLYNVLWDSLTGFGRAKLERSGSETMVCYTRGYGTRKWYPRLSLSQIRDTISKVRFDIKNGQ